MSLESGTRKLLPIYFYKLLALLFVFPFSLFFVACQSLPASQPVVFTSPHLAKETIAPEFLFQTLTARRAGLIDLKSFARTTITKNKTTHSFKQALLLIGDDSLRIDTLGIFGQPKGIFIHDKNKTLLYDTQQKRMYRGHKAWVLMEKIIGSVIDFDEYISLLSGNIPRLAEFTLASGRLGFEKKYYKLDTLDASGNTRFLIDMDAFSLDPVKLVKEVDFRDTYTVEWQDYRRLGGYSFPHRIILTRPAEGERLIIKYRAPVINSGITPASFKFTPPSTAPQN